MAPVERIAPPSPHGSARGTARVAGALYLLTFASVPTLALYAPVHEADYVIGTGPDTPVLTGAALELFVALACIGTAVVLYPILKRQNPVLALAFLGARVLEAGTIFAGVASLLAVVSLRQAGVGPEAADTGQALVALHDAFRLGQGFLPAVNAVLLGAVLYRSRLVPRVLPTLGLVGAPLLLAATGATMFGVVDAISPVTAVAVVPIFLWEFSLGLYLLIKGFRPSPLTTGSATGHDPAPVTAVNVQQVSR
jgi:hypothetical protein